MTQNNEKLPQEVIDAIEEKYGQDNYLLQQWIKAEDRLPIFSAGKGYYGGASTQRHTIRHRGCEFSRGWFEYYINGKPRAHAAADGNPYTWEINEGIEWLEEISLSDLIKSALAAQPTPQGESEMMGMSTQVDKEPEMWSRDEVLKLAYLLVLQRRNYWYKYTNTAEATYSHTKWLIKNGKTDEAIGKIVSSLPKFEPEDGALSRPTQQEQPNFSADIDTVGKCANCGVEFHIHKTTQQEQTGYKYPLMEVVPVEDGLPTEDGYYHVISRDGRSDFDYFRKEIGWKWGDVTDWLRPAKPGNEVMEKMAEALGNAQKMLDRLYNLTEMNRQLIVKEYGARHSDALSLYTQTAHQYT